MRVIDHGALTGYISINRSWAGYDSFGIPVQEHSASMQIDLMEGYTFADVAQKPGNMLADGQSPQEAPDAVPEQEQLPMEIIDQKTGEVIKI